MVQEMTGSPANYGFNEAMDDLLKYYAYGTWDHAMTSLQTATAANANACKGAVAKAKVAAATDTVTPASSTTNACNPTTSPSTTQ
jgi:hypothetical protein